MSKSNLCVIFIGFFIEYLSNIGISQVKILLLSLFWIAYPTASFAYIEPGMGSLLLQSMFGILIGFFVYYQHACNFIKKIFKKITGNEKEEDQEQGKEQDKKLAN